MEREVGTGGKPPGDNTPSALAGVKVKLGVTFPSALKVFPSRESLPAPPSVPGVEKWQVGSILSDI